MLLKECNYVILSESGVGCGGSSRDGPVGAVQAVIHPHQQACIVQVIFIVMFTTNLIKVNFYKIDLLIKEM